MFLSLATTHRPATDLGYLLHKHPDRLHVTDVSFGRALVLYPEATEARCEAALLLEVDPVGLVRGRGQGEGLLDQYVNDRPYAASSFLAVALNRALRSAMAGTSRDRPDLARTPIPLEARVLPLPARGGDRLVRALFEPLGWTVATAPLPGPDGGASSYLALTLSGTGLLSALLTHLYVLIPVLDDDKHYWIGDDEVAKLLDRGQGWLEDHPEKDLIVRRYLKHRRALARDALRRLVPEAEAAEPDAQTRAPGREEALETPLRLNDRRYAAVQEVLAEAAATRVVDLGCGEGKLLDRLARDRRFTALTGVDAASAALAVAARRLKLEVGSGDRLRLLQGALTYRDRRWHDTDAVTLVEVIEHLEPDALAALEAVVFADARPPLVVVTTPNAEHNALFPDLPAGRFRHPDHRFEWTRAEFAAWAERVAGAHGYAATFAAIGDDHPQFGPPTQMAVFRRAP